MDESLVPPVFREDEELRSFFLESRREEHTPPYKQDNHEFPLPIDKVLGDLELELVEEHKSAMDVSDNEGCNDGSTSVESQDWFPSPPNCTSFLSPCCKHNQNQALAQFPETDYTAAETDGMSFEGSLVQEQGDENPSSYFFENYLALQSLQQQLSTEGEPSSVQQQQVRSFSIGTAHLGGTEPKSSSYESLERIRVSPVEVETNSIPAERTTRQLSNYQIANLRLIHRKYQGLLREIKEARRRYAQLIQGSESLVRRGYSGNSMDTKRRRVCDC